MDYTSFLTLKPLQMIVSLLDYSWVIIIYPFTFSFNVSPESIITYYS